MKTRVIFLLATAAAGCSSSPSSSTPPLNTGGAGSGSIGASAGMAGGGTAGAVAAGGPGGGGTPQAGSGGSAGTMASAGSAGAVATAGGASGGGAGGGGAGGGGASAGVGGASNVAGAAGAPVDPGNLMNFVPAGYTGTPYGGTAQTIPGKIEVEKYDLGGLNVAFKASTDAAFNRCGLMRNDAIKLECTGQAGPQDQNYADCANYPAGSAYVGYINTGDWYKYTVNVVEAGSYVISGHEGVAANTQMQFTFTDAVKTQPITLPATGGKCTSEAYHVWAVQDNLGEIALTPGKYVLTINVVAAAMNLDWFAFTKKP